MLVVRIRHSPCERRNCDPRQLSSPETCYPTHVYTVPGTLGGLDGTSIYLKHNMLEWKKCNVPIFVAVTECKDKVRQLFHDSLGCSIHDVEPILIVRLDELIL